MAPKLVAASMQLFDLCVDNLPRTPIKHHYIFNLRDMSRIFQGLCRSSIDKFKEKVDFV
jgi:dynein heavy chain